MESYANQNDLDLLGGTNQLKIAATSAELFARIDGNTLLGGDGNDTADFRSTAEADARSSSNSLQFGDGNNKAKLAATAKAGDVRLTENTVSALGGNDLVDIRATGADQAWVANSDVALGDGNNSTGITASGKATFANAYGNSIGGGSGNDKVNLKAAGGGDSGANRNEALLGDGKNAAKIAVSSADASVNADLNTLTGGADNDAFDIGATGRVHASIVGNELDLSAT